MTGTVPKQNERSLEERIAYRNHIVTDQGNGGSYCSNCSYDFGPSAMKRYDTCPKCDYTVIEGTMWINPGGSDFP